MGYFWASPSPFGARPSSSSHGSPGFFGSRPPQGQGKSQAVIRLSVAWQSRETPGRGVRCVQVLAGSQVLLMAARAFSAFKPPPPQICEVGDFSAFYPLGNGTVFGYSRSARSSYSFGDPSRSSFHKVDRSCSL